MNRFKFRAWDGEKMNYEFIIARPRFVDLLSILQNEEFAVRTYNSITEWKVMQFTGLFDKNDSEIWEGDVLKVNGYNRAFEVKYFSEFGIYGLFGKDEMKPLGREGSSTKYAPYLLGIPFWRKKIETIGNIYENPELLK